MSFVKFTVFVWQPFQFTYNFTIYFYYFNILNAIRTCFVLAQNLITSLINFNSNDAISCQMSWTYFLSFSIVIIKGVFVWKILQTFAQINTTFLKTSISDECGVKINFQSHISKLVDFPKWSKIFIEFSDFSEFKESDKSLKHQLG